MLPVSDIKAIKNIHLVGVCGTGMASLAGMLKERGFRVTGSDVNVYPPMSDFLARLGIPVTRGYAEANLEPRPDLVVIGNALSRGNPEVEAVLDRKMLYASMPEVVKEWFLRDQETIVVAGTHGKTTTASLLAWLLENAGAEPSFLIGGIAANFESSFQLRQGRYFVIEGDEYDSAFFDKGPKFVHYLPRQLILNPVEFDHADIYADLDSILTAFKRLVNLVPRSGKIVAAGESANVRDCVAGAFCRVEFFGLGDGALWRASGLETAAEGTRYELAHDGRSLGEFFLPMAGEFNVANAVAATAIAMGLGLSVEVVRRALSSFRGVGRRQQVRGRVAGVTVIDDFAHHPTAIALTLEAVRACYPKGRVWAVLEPRSNTLRRKIFQKELERSFQGADQILFAPIHRRDALRAEDRLDLTALVESLRRQGKGAVQLPSAREIVEYVSPRLEPGDVVVVMSNGGFDGIHDLFLQALQVCRGEAASREHSSLE